MSDVRGRHVANLQRETEAGAPPPSLSTSLGARAPGAPAESIPTYLCCGSGGSPRFLAQLRSGGHAAATDGTLILRPPPKMNTPLVKMKTPPIKCHLLGRAARPP